jgi:superfamily II DNA or RNA helicase
MSHNFITNNASQGITLKKRLQKLMTASVELKFLVGFFYFSGWQEIYRTLKENDKITLKILVGLHVDKHLGSLIEYGDQKRENGLSREEHFAAFIESLGKAINNADMDTEMFYEQLEFFIQMLQDDRLIIKKTLNPNHAKLYLFKVNDSQRNLWNMQGTFITGSSNLTKAGLHGQEEFNVEIKDYGFEHAEKYFDDLWDIAIPITEANNGKQILIDFLKNKSIGTHITPFEAYTYVLKTVVDLQEIKKLSAGTESLLESNGFEKYQYQLDAVNQALSILDEYNGVIIADVVGLGKSVIASLIAYQLNRPGLILCPPGLIGNQIEATGWWEYVKKFNLNSWYVDSSGNLETIADNINKHNYEVVIVDEAHRFRNQDTSAYDALKTICANKKVILLSATPFNNSPADIFSLLKLFIVPGASSITLEEDIEARFTNFNSIFKQLSFINKNWNSPKSDNREKASNYYKKLFDTNEAIDLKKVQEFSKQIANEIKNTINPVVIRRNRIDLQTDFEYKKEIDQLSTVDDPQEIFFELTEKQSEFYTQIISKAFGEGGLFTGAIYQPALYATKSKKEEKLSEEENRSFLQQKNLYDFMRRILVKRFESSFGAFNESINRFLRVHKLVLDFIEKSDRYFLDRKVLESYYDDESGEFTEEAIENALADFAENAKTKTKPKHTIIYNVNKFYQKEEFIANIKADIKLFERIAQEVKKLNLLVNDPKRKAVASKVEDIITKKESPKRKVIIFTEYADTVSHLKDYFIDNFSGRVLCCNGVVNKSFSETLNSNFNAKYETKNDDYDILITSDKLSEGFNLNRAGTIINYDIPWNPTRVIQRVGRINRMSAKVFDLLYIYNIFPTDKGATIIKSREIASQKMFLIHNALGEDAKIFDADEEPTASGLFTKLTQNPEEGETVNIETKIRNTYQEIKNKYPEVIEKVSQLPSRTKTAKLFKEENTIVLRKKGLALFSLKGAKTEGKHQVTEITLEELIDYIECTIEENRLGLNKDFWESYELIKAYKPKYRAGSTNIRSFEQKALTGLHALIKFSDISLDQATIAFINTLIRDIKKYKTLSDFTLRRLALNEKKNQYEVLVKNIHDIRRRLGDDYLEKIIERASSINDDIIIAIRNEGKKH